MSEADEHTKRERRRRLIERLNEKEKLIWPKSPGDLRGGQMSEEELAAEIEKQRVLKAESFPPRWVLVLLGYTFSSHQSS